MTVDRVTEFATVQELLSDSSRWSPHEFGRTNGGTARRTGHNPELVEWSVSAALEAIYGSLTPLMFEKLSQVLAALRELHGSISLVQFEKRANHAELMELLRKAGV